MALFSYGGQQNLPLMQEVGVDFHTGQPLLEPDGSFRLVSGLEAVRVWVWRALQPDHTRFAYSAHTVSYGNQFHLLAGKSLPQAEITSVLSISSPQSTSALRMSRTSLNNIKEFPP